MNLFLLRYEDLLTISLLILSIIVVTAAHFYIKKTFADQKTNKTKSGITGFEAARKMLDKNGLQSIHIVEVKQELSDHYDPTRKVIRLSTPIFHDSSIASVAIAAHEAGHAVQDKEGYIFMRIRAALVPVVKLVSYMGYFAIIVAIFAGITGYLMIGIYMLVATLIFQLVTLPVEFDASKRAQADLVSLGVVASDEEEKVKTMLTAAALTYVAGLISTLLNLLRLILMARRR